MPYREAAPKGEDFKESEETPPTPLFDLRGEMDRAIERQGLKPPYIRPLAAADPDDEPEPFLVAEPPQCKWCGTSLETYESPCSFSYCNERNHDPCDE